MKRSVAFSLMLVSLLASIAGQPLAMAATTVSPRVVESETTGVIRSALGGDTTATVLETIGGSCRLTNGTGTGKVDLAPFVRIATLGTSASTTYDLTSYTDVAGNSVTTMTKMRYFRFENTGTVSIDLGGAAATQVIGTGFLVGATDLIRVAGGQSVEFCYSAGTPISATIKLLKVLNTSGSVTAPYRLLIVGGST